MLQVVDLVLRAGTAVRLHRHAYILPERELPADKTDVQSLSLAPCVRRSGEVQYLRQPTFPVLTIVRDGMIYSVVEQLKFLLPLSSSTKAAATFRLPHTRARAHTHTHTHTHRKAKTISLVFTVLSETAFAYFRQPFSLPHKGRESSYVQITKCAHNSWQSPKSIYSTCCTSEILFTVQ